MGLIRKIIILIALIPLFIFFAYLSSIRVNAQTNSTEEALRIRVGIYENPPKIYRDDMGIARGFWAEVLDYIAIRQNWQIEYVSGTFREGLERLQNQEIDIMVDVGYSTERAKLYDFSGQTAFINWAGVYSSMNLEVNSIAELDGKRIAVLDGDIHYIGPLGIKNLLESFGYSAEFITTGSYADNLKAVEDGLADIAIVNRLFGSQNEGNYNVRRTSIVYNPIELKFAFTKGGTKTDLLKSTIDQELIFLKDDTESIYYKSIIEDLEGIVKTVEVTPPWLWPLIVGSVLSVIFSISLYLLSKRYQKLLEIKVKEKTEELLRSETKYKELTDLLPQTVFEIDKEMKIRYVNAMAEKLFGYKYSQFINNLSLKDLFSDTLLDEVTKQEFPNLNEMKQLNFEFVAKRNDGTTFPAYVYLSRIVTDGVLQGFRGIIYDITEQKESQSKLNEKIDELEVAMRLMIEKGF